MFPFLRVSLVLKDGDFSWMWARLFLWRIIPFTILCSIWREINERILKGSSSSVARIILDVSLRNVRWILVIKEFDRFNMTDILSNWEACKSCGRK